MSYNSSRSVYYESASVPSHTHSVSSFSTGGSIIPGQVRETRTVQVVNDPYLEMPLHSDLAFHRAGVIHGTTLAPHLASTGLSGRSVTTTTTTTSGGYTTGGITHRGIETGGLVTDGFHTGGHVHLAPAPLTTRTIGGNFGTTAGSIIDGSVGSFGISGGARSAGSSYGGSSYSSYSSYSSSSR